MENFLILETEDDIVMFNENIVDKVNYDLEDVLNILINIKNKKIKVIKKIINESNKI